MEFVNSAFYYLDTVQIRVDITGMPFSAEFVFFYFESTRNQIIFH